MSFTPGAQCGGYEILGLLGTGGMGEVRAVAIQVGGFPRPELCRRQKRRIRFRRSKTPASTRLWKGDWTVWVRTAP